MAAFAIKNSYLRTCGSHHEAVMLMERFLRKYTSLDARAFGYAMLASDYAEMGELKKAEDLSRAAIELADSVVKPMAVDTLAWVLYRKGRLRESYEMLRESLILDPGRVPTLYRLIVVLLAMGKKKDADPIVRQLIELREEGGRLPQPLLRSLRNHITGMIHEEREPGGTRPGASLISPAFISSWGNPARWSMWGKPRISENGWLPTLSTSMTRPASFSDSDTLEYFVTASEVEALILENNSIKKHKPRHNVLLKDDKTYPSVEITSDDVAPGIYFTRKRNRPEAAISDPILRREP
ncbi:MAG: hypothetical protein MZV49_09235 [Rhodopseudomonas palustris]|nr:hypothetical protein [Rhodopseudomonas palustris]